jgi:hypothetical protein
MSQFMPHPSIEERRDAIPSISAPEPSYPAPLVSLREALTCLETAGTRLRSGEAAEADEVLRLLRAATVHLQQALDR